MRDSCGWVVGWSTNADIIFLTFQSVSYFRHLNCYVMATMYLWTLDYILNNIQLPYHFFVTIIHSFTLEINKIIWKIKAAAVTTPRSHHHHHQGSGQDQNHPVWRDFPRSDLRRGKIPRGEFPRGEFESTGGTVSSVADPATLPGAGCRQKRWNAGSVGERGTPRMCALQRVSNQKS